MPFHYRIAILVDDWVTVLVQNRVVASRPQDQVPTIQEVFFRSEHAIQVVVSFGSHFATTLVNQSVFVPRRSKFREIEECNFIFTVTDHAG